MNLGESLKLFNLFQWKQKIVVTVEHKPTTKSISRIHN